MDSLAVQQVTTLLMNARANLVVGVDPETEDTTQLLNSKIQQAYFWVSQALALIQDSETYSTQDLQD